MPSPSEKLADSLEALQKLQKQGFVAIRSTDLSRTHRERLSKHGFLQEVMKGWYIPARPDETTGESTAWFASFWDFCVAYFTERFASAWCLSPEQSLSLHVGNRSVPKQLLIRTPRGSNNLLKLPYETSLLDVKASLPNSGDMEEKDGLRVYALPAAFVACSPGYFQQNPTDARAALSTIQDASDVLGKLLDGGHTAIAGRLAGAFRNIGRDRIADDIIQTMRAADYDVREQDPFDYKTPNILTTRERSPYVNRLRLMWQSMRAPIIKHFPKAPGLPRDTNAYLAQVEETYVTDAYHSLSIEGYRVNRDLIERVRLGSWNPDTDTQDQDHRNAMAARGYWQAYQAVRNSLHPILVGENAGEIADRDHGAWYRELFAPSVAAGLLKASDLAGYRNDQVYIRRSMHVPPSKEAVRDLMPVFFDLLREENEPAVRVVLGHFLFVYIHPYMDGNGRIGRFMMNTMLASGGYPWTVIPVERRGDYLSALELGSVAQDIEPFCKFLAELVKDTLRGKPDAKAP